MRLKTEDFSSVFFILLKSFSSRVFSPRRTFVRLSGENNPRSTRNLLRPKFKGEPSALTELRFRLRIFGYTEKDNIKVG